MGPKTYSFDLQVHSCLSTSACYVVSSPNCMSARLIGSKRERGGRGGSHLRCEVCQGLGDGVCAGGEGLHLKDAHGAVPDDGLGALQGRLELLDGLGADVQTLLIKPN